METDNELQPTPPERKREARSRSGLRAGLAGLAVAALLTVGAVSVFAADAEESASPDSSATPSLTDPVQAGDRGDCPDDGSN